jgi:hypothetical protein
MSTVVTKSQNFKFYKEVNMALFNKDIDA